VAAAADRLQAEDARVTADEGRAAEAGGHRERAEAAFAAGDYEESVRESRAALALDPSLSGATQVLGAAQARVREIADAKARTAAVAAHVQRAEEFVSRGAFAKAAREAQRGLEIEPEHAGARAIVEAIRQREADAAAAQARDLARREQDRLIEAALKAARASLRAGRFAEAQEKAEAALSWDPNHPEAHALAEQALAARAQAGASASDDESTVDMAGTPAALDPEDTVSVRSELPRAAVVPSSVAAAVGKWAAHLMHRVRRPGAR
jgi:tetratricopeptide (TPR) repeat protein